MAKRQNFVVGSTNPNTESLSQTQLNRAWDRYAVLKSGVLDGTLNAISDYSNDSSNEIANAILSITGSQPTGESQTELAGALGQMRQDIETSSLTFKGYVATTEPSSSTYGLVEGNLWINSATLPTSFPVAATDIKVWDGSAWVVQSNTYTVADFDFWRNVNDNEGYYWFGGQWVIMSTDMSTTYFTLNQTSGKWEIKDSVNLPGSPTAATPTTSSPQNQIATKRYVDEAIGGSGTGRNVGDIFFTTRKDNTLNGAVECNGGTYSTADFTQAQSIGNLLENGKLPYVSLATYSTLLSTQGSVGVFGWDGTGTTAFRVPSLNDIFLETGTVAQVGDYIAPGAPNITGSISIPSYNTGEASVSSTGCMQSTQTGSNVRAIGYADQGYPPMVTTLDASRSSSVYSNSVNTIQPNAVRYRAMVQLAISASDEALATCTAVTAQVAINTSDIATLAGQAYTRTFTNVDTVIASSPGSGSAGTYTLGFTDNKIKLGIFRGDFTTTQNGNSSMAISTDVVTGNILICATSNTFATAGTVTVPFINSVTLSFPAVAGGIGNNTLKFMGWM